MCADADYDGHERENDQLRIFRLVVLPSDHSNDGSGQHFEQLIGADGVVFQREIGEDHESTESDGQRQNSSDRYTFPDKRIHLQTDHETQWCERHLNGS